MDGSLLLIELNEKYEIIHINQKAASSYEVVKQQCLGKTYDVLASKRGADSLLKADVFNTYAIQEDIKIELALEENRKQIIAWTIIPQQQSSGVYHYLLIGNELTTLVDIEIKHIKLQTYLDNILEQIPGFLYWKDLNSVYLGCNAYFAKVAGLDSPAEIIGKTDYDLAWNKTEAELFIKGDHETIANRGKINFEEPQHMANGKVATVLASKVPLYDHESNIIGILGIYTDITERKQAEKELAIAKLEAEASDEAKTDFLTTISHELRTPLSGIVSVADLLKISELNPQQNELVDILYKSSKLLLRLVDDLLDFSKLELGKLDLLPNFFSLKQIAHDVIFSLQLKAKEKNIALDFIYDAQLPSFIYADPYRIKQIIINLINNALKFTHHGYIKLIISQLTRTEKDVFLQLEVIDSGIGISKQNQAKIFERFYQIENTNRGRYRGAGLGLSIVKQLIVQMGGSIEVKSELGKGTTFICKLTLPYQRELQGLT
jgi:two-component system aerobic respiration control sensor histidine kinase ArcB